jgi:hypothetical protein
MGRDRSRAGDSAKGRHFEIWISTQLPVFVGFPRSGFRLGGVFCGLAEICSLFRISPQRG